MWNGHQQVYLSFHQGHIMFGFFFNLDYEWIVRAARVLWAIGDFAFRELTIYFEKIDTFQTPEWIQCHFNVNILKLVFVLLLFYVYILDCCYICTWSK